MEKRQFAAGGGPPRNQNAPTGWEGRAHPTAKRTYRVGGHRTLPTPNAPTGWVALALMQPSCPAHNFTFPIRQIGPQGNMQNPALGARMATYDYAWGIYYNAT